MIPFIPEMPDFDEHDGDLGMFELPARKKLLNAKKAARRDKELSMICDIADDLVSLTGKLSRAVLRYVDRVILPTSEEDEYNQLKRIIGYEIGFDIFRLLKHLVRTHDQRTQAASQLVDVLQSTPEEAKAYVIRAALEVWTNPDDYFSPTKHDVDISKLESPISMSPVEFKAANKLYDMLLNKVDALLKNSRKTEQEKCERLAQFLTPRRSRMCKALILTRAWGCKLAQRVDESVHDIDRFIEERTRSQITASSSDHDVIIPTPNMPDIEVIRNGLMEDRLRRLFNDEDDSEGGNE